MRPYLAAAIQMTSTPDLAKNLNEAEELIDLAVRQGAEVIGLPENFSFLGKEVDKIAQAAAIAEKTEKFLKTIAQRFQITLLGGGFPVPDGAETGKAFNTALMIG
ncbi:MAG: nitrilase-related carbon-nitrogen hydrolase, partial [Cyanobacteria bacterium P01_H01_bin.15]